MRKEAAARTHLVSRLIRAIRFVGYSVVLAVAGTGVVSAGIYALPRSHHHLRLRRPRPRHQVIDIVRQIIFQPVRRLQ